MSDPVAIIKIKPGGLIYLAEPGGGLFDIEKYVGASLYTADEPQYVRDLFTAIDDLIETITDDVKDLPDTVQLSIAFANFVMARARIERNKE